jgi:hypothetical protein
VKETNNKLRSQMVLHGETQKRVAAEMGINARVFNNKLRQRTVYGYVIRFTPAQKEWLA